GRRIGGRRTGGPACRAARSRPGRRFQDQPRSAPHARGDAGALSAPDGRLSRGAAGGVSRAGGAVRPGMDPRGARGCAAGRPARRARAGRLGLILRLDRTSDCPHLRPYKPDERRPMSENTKAVTDQSFASDVLQASGPVLVDFWAEWCGPCKAIAPALEEIASEYQGKLTIAKVNIDDNPVTPNNYAVRGIPTLILFKDGKPAATQVGALPKSRLKDWIASSI